MTYFRFPRDPYKRKIWLTALGINWEPPKTATICSYHFTESDFENWTTQRILKETAVPASAGIFDQFVSDPNPISEEPTPTSTYSEVPKVCSKFLSKSILHKDILHLVLCIMYQFHIFYRIFLFFRL